MGKRLQPQLLKVESYARLTIRWRIVHSGDFGWRAAGELCRIGRDQHDKAARSIRPYAA
jgi:hypothetical protein